MIWFTSDNAGPAHPRVIDAIAEAAAGYSGAYGAEEAMTKVTARIRDIFEAPQAAVYLVSTGTAANALSLACLCPPWAATYCHREAHIEEDECGAPEFFTGGAKLTLIDGDHGRMDPDALGRALAGAASVGVHNVQRGAVSLTQTTEAGTVYSLDQIRALTALARAHDLPVHMDGARFANALVRLGCSPADMTWRAGVDVLSFGGTKNGLMAAEAVILFDPARAWEFELRRKRAAHLLSKHRILSAQMLAYLTDELWRDMASAANARAATLASGLMGLAGARLRHPVDANAMFVDLPRHRHDAARAAGAQYYFWGPQPAETGPADELLLARLICNWATTEAEVATLLDALAD